MNLICDFDGTLYKNDFFEEQFFKLLITKPFKVLGVIFKANWLLILKIDILNNYFPDYNTTFLINDEVVKWISENGSLFDKKLLISASSNLFVKRIIGPLQMFDEIHGSIDKNLKGVNKLLFIEEMKLKPFIYIGDSVDDKIIFKAAEYAYLIKDNKMIKIK